MHKNGRENFKVPITYMLYNICLNHKLGGGGQGRGINNKKVQTLHCKMNKAIGPNIQSGDYS